MAGGCPVFSPVLLGEGRLKDLSGLMRHPLFQDLYDPSSVAHIGAADEQMEMLPHEHVAVDTESVPTASILQHCQKYFFDAVVVKQWLAPVATASDEVRL
jgi:hypothetical protein